MKTLTIAIMAVFLMAAFAVPMVLAEDNTSDTAGETVTSESPETTSTETVSEETEAELELNEGAGNGKIAWKQFQLWFTFNQEKKIEGEIELAKLRLIQAKIAAENNDSAAVEKAMEAHEKIMERIQERVNNLDGASDAEGLNDSAVKLVGLERAIQVHERRIAYLSSVLENANLTEAQRAKIETKLQSMKENVGDLKKERWSRSKQSLWLLKI
jgi:hypothetical protein